MTAGDFKQSPTLIGGVLVSGQIVPNTISFTGLPTAGTFTLTVTSASGAQTTTSISYSSGLTAATVAAALGALSNVGTGKAVVTGANGGPFVVGFVPTSQGALTLTATPSLTGGTTPSMTVAQAGTIEVPVYTVPAASAVDVATAVVSNPYGALVTAGLSVVLPAAAAVDLSSRAATITMQPGESYAVTEVQGDFWQTGTVLSINATAAVNLKVTGAVSA